MCAHAKSGAQRPAARVGPAHTAQAPKVEGGLAEDTLDRRDHRTRRELLDRIRAEFNYMAGMSLTPQQAYRLFQIDPSLGERLLTELVHAGFLRRMEDGSYSRS